MQTSNNIGWFVITHCERKTPRLNSWIPISFMARRINTDGPFLKDLQEDQHLSIEEVNDLVKVGVFKKILPVPRITAGQKVWLGEDGTILIAKTTDPLEDRSRHYIHGTIPVPFHIYLIIKIRKIRKKLREYKNTTTKKIRCLWWNLTD